MNGRRGGAVDVVVVLLLMAVTLSILDDTFADPDYLVVGLAPGVGLVVLALVTRGLHEGGWVYALGAVTAFAPVGALFALGRPGPYLLPTLETMSRVVGDSVTAPALLVSTATPVDTDGQVMLVPFLIGYFGVGFAAWLALGTTSPIGPAVPLVLAMAGTIPVGVLVPTALVQRGVVFAIVLIVWVAARARRRESLVGRNRGALTTTATAAAVVTLVSFAAGAVVPDRVQDDRVLLRGDGESDLVSGAASSVLPDQIGARQQLFRATGVPEGRRLRLAVLDSYDGYLWAPADVSPGTDGFGTFKRIGERVEAAHDGQLIQVHVQMRSGYAADWLPLLGELTSLDLEEFDGRTQLEDVRYNTTTSTALVVGGVDPRDDYTFSAVLLDDGLTGDDRMRVATADQRQPAGEFLDPYLAPFVRDELSPVQRVLLLARYLRTHGATRFTGESLQGPDDLGRGMLGSRDMTGTPFQYAALMALGASRLGVPARLVTGAAPGRKGIVEHKDVGVWVELQLDDGTWSTLEPRRYVGGDLVRDDDPDPPVDDAGGFVADLLDGTPTDPTGSTGDGQEQSTTVDEESEDPDAAAPPRVGLRAVGVVLAAALLALLLVPVAKTVRRARRRRTSSWTGAYVHGWQEVLDAARDRGTPVPDAWSRTSQARELGVGLDLARRADAAVFAPGESPGDDGRAFWRDCQELRHDLLRAVDVRHRVWALLNPASLLAGWARSRSRDGSGDRPVRHEDRRARRQHPAGA